MKSKETTDCVKTVFFRYGILFILLTGLCWLFPYTGDDWAWGSSIGMDRLHAWFRNYNGRYLGNLSVILLTRSNLIKALVMAATLSGIIFCFEKIIQRQWVFCVSCLLLILLPKQIIQQAIVWTSGFSNYVISVLLILLYIAYVYPVLSGKLPEKKYWHAIPLFVLGVSAALFVEHVTVYEVVMAFGVVFYTAIRHKKVFFQHISFLAGSIVGAYVMFSNGAYHRIVNQEDGYRSIVSSAGEGGIFSVIPEQLALNNIWLNLLLAVVCGVLFYQWKQTLVEKKQGKIAACSLAVIAIYAVWSAFSVPGLGVSLKQDSFQYFEAGFTLLFVLSLIIFTVLIGICCDCLWKMLFWNGSILCLALPLFVVTPIGPRCFFVTYIMYVLLFMELCCQCQPLTERLVSVSRMISSACLVTAIVGMAFYFFIFSSVAHVDRERLQHIKEEMAAGEERVEIKHLPYESFLWTSTPMEDEWKRRYKLFHHLPADLAMTDVWEYGNSKK